MAKAATKVWAGARGRRRVGVVGVALVVGLGLLGAGDAARGQVRGTIVGPGATSYPIAVSPLRTSGTAASAGERFADIVTKDLELSGIFRVIDRAAYLENPQTTGVTSDAIDFRDWTTIGAQALIKGSLEADGDRIVVEARLFDVVEARQLGGKRYRASANELRRVAHRFADEVMLLLTGERGPFDSQIAFTSRVEGRFKDVVVMSLDGGDLHTVTHERSIVLSPTWSPDAGSLLFTSFRTGNPSLFEVSAAGGAPRLISSRLGLNLGGRWAPGGRAIAVALERGGTTDVALLDPSGGLLHFVTQGSAIDVSPSWSPDGRSLAFCSDRGGGPQIYVTDARGGDAHRVTFSGGYNTSPAWSPKGDRIAYASRVSGHFQIFTSDLQGRDVVQVTRTPGDNEDPAWSPDGRYLIFSSTRAGRRGIYLSDAAGRSQRRLTAPGGDDTSPAWSRWLD
jgi:TolB protein